MQRAATVEFNHFRPSGGQGQVAPMGGNIDMELIDVSRGRRLVLWSTLKTLAIETDDHQRIVPELFVQAVLLKRCDNTSTSTSSPRLFAAEVFAVSGNESVH